METVLLVLMLLVCFGYVLKQTFRRPAAVILSAVVCALFTGLAWPWAIEQSKRAVADWLADAGLMLDVAVVLTLEVALQMTFCILSAHILTTGRVAPRTIRLYRLLRWFPGVLVYPVLFSLLVAAIFALPGVSFRLTAWVLAAVVPVVILGGARVLRWLLPEKEIRLELLFLTNALAAVLGIIATVNGRTAVAAIGGVEWSALGGVMLFVAAGVAAGVLRYRFKMKRTIKKQTIR